MAKVLTEHLTGVLLVTTLPALYGIQMFIIVSTKPAIFSTVLSHTNSVHALTTYFFKIYFNITLTHNTYFFK